MQVVAPDFLRSRRVWALFDKAVGQELQHDLAVLVAQLVRQAHATDILTLFPVGFFLKPGPGAQPVAGIDRLAPAHLIPSYAADPGDISENRVIQDPPDGQRMDA